jgi:hypothetical protein
VASVTPNEESTFEVSRDATAADLAEAWLAQVYELVARGWCQGEVAVNEAGIAVEPDSRFARRWSATGALTRVWRRAAVDDVVGLHALGRANLALMAAMNEIPKTWNDAPGRRQEHVLEAILWAVSLVRDPYVLEAQRRQAEALA